MAFYNLENLFDTIDDPNKDDEISPILEIKRNRSEIYWDRIKKLSTVIAQIGKERSNTSPVVIGLAEVENYQVLDDLVDSKELASKEYEIIHYDSPDKRGIDVALLYQPRYFKPIHHEIFDPKIYKAGYRVFTRDILLVTGYLDNELIHILVNHWPSRRGGKELTERMREKAAYQNRMIIERLKNDENSPKVLIIGDFNDDPIDNSFKKALKTKSKKEALEQGGIYNPFELMFRRGLNTLGHRDQINLFDQILITGSFIAKNSNDYTSYKMYRAGIFNKSFLTVQKGRYKGYPFRSFSNGNYTGGYSDHYPVYLYLIKER